MEELNPAERQQVWTRRIDDHAKTCAACRENQRECETWQVLVSYYNAAALVGDLLPWREAETQTGGER